MNVLYAREKLQTDYIVLCIHVLLDDPDSKLYFWLQFRNVSSYEKPLTAYQQEHYSTLQYNL